MTLFSTLSEPYVLLLFLYLGAVCGLIFYFARFIFSFLDRRKLLSTDLLENEKSPKKGGIKNNLLKDQKDALKQKKGHQKSEKTSNKRKKTREIKNFLVPLKKESENIVVRHEKIESQSKTNFETAKEDKKSLKKEKRSKSAKKALKQKNKQLKVEKKKNDKILLKEKRQEMRKKRKVKRKEFFIKTGHILVACLLKIGQLIAQTGKFVIFVALVFATYLCNLKLNYGEINIVCIIAYIFAFFLSGYFLKLLAKFFVAFYTKKRKTKENQSVTKQPTKFEKYKS